MRDHELVIDGRLVSTPDWDEVINPALAEPFARAARATTAHLDEAVAAAARALAGWRQDQALRRRKLVESADALQARAQEIGAVLSTEQGKPIKAAVGEVLGAAGYLRWFAALETPPEVLRDDDKRRIEVVRRPHGVVAAITPWNFPVILLAWKLAPALLAGNTVVAKPSPFTPLSSLMVGAALREILPAGVLNVISGGAELGAALVAHPTVRKVAFTGSVSTGKRIAAAAAEDLKHVTLELGGNDPAIVLPDVDPAQVVERLFWGAFYNSGQVCVAIKRLYLHEDVHDRIVDGLVARARATRVGSGLDPATELGPINNRMQLDKVSALVEDARQRGATVASGGAASGPGYFYPPTIVTGAVEGMRLVDEEQFGTALPVVRYRDVEQAIAEANRSHYGLGGSVWTADVERGRALVGELECGTGWVNQHQDLTPLAPFGGVKWSGIGYEGGKQGYEEFSSLQVVNIRR